MQLIFDEELLLRHKRRALADRTDGATFLLERATEDLVDRLSSVGRRFSNGVCLFCATDSVSRSLLGTGKVDEVTRVERHPDFIAGGPGLVGSFERLPDLPAPPDLVVSLLSLQDANDLPGTLIQIRRLLKPDGLFLGAMAGGGTLQELRESLLSAEAELYGGASPRIAPFTDVRDAGALLQRAGFALPVADVEKLTVRYDSMFGLLADLRAMGVGNALLGRSGRPVSRRLFTRAAEIYSERFADLDGRVRATFAIVWMSGWSPHPSQQQPLKPGSATVPLSRVLKS